MFVAGRITKPLAILKTGVDMKKQTETLLSEAIDLELRAVLNPGETVLYHEPCYVSYAPSITLAHAQGRAIRTRAEDGFRLDPRAVAEAATGAKVLLLNFPTNPTGAVLRGRELDELAKVCVEKNLLVIRLTR